MFKKGVTVFKALQEGSPMYLHQIFTHVKDTHHVNSRSAAHGDLYVSKPRKNFLKCTISYTGAMIWNSLPNSVKNCKNLPEFKRTCAAHIQSLRSNKHV